VLPNNSSSKARAGAGAANLGPKAPAAAARSGAGLARKPGASLGWALEVLTKTVTLADRRFSTPRASSLET
jgi:hypothetical protein